MDEQNRSIKVKAYLNSEEASDFGLLIYLLYLLSAGMAIYLMISESDALKLILGIFVCIAFPTLFLAADLLVLHCEKVYDIYNIHGVTRIHKDKVILEIRWSNVEEIIYDGTGFPLLAPKGIVAILKDPIVLMKNVKGENISYQKLDFFRGAMKKKTALAIEKQFLPPGLKIQFK